MPGSCSLIDRTLPEAGAQVILFKGTAVEGEAVATTLTRSKGYWRFVVSKQDSGAYKDEGGFYVARTHGEWVPAASKPSASVPGVN